MTATSAQNPILHKAIVKGNLKSVQFWIKKHEDIETKNFDGQSALHYAVSMNKLSIVEFLLGKGAKIDEKDKRGFTPLHFAVSKDYKPIIEMLIKHNANLEARHSDAQKHHCILRLKKDLQTLYKC